MHFKENEHYVHSSRVNTDAGSVYGPVSIDVSHWHKACNTLKSIFVVGHGAARVQVDITPAEARTLANNLLTHANEVEAHQLQLDADEAKIAAAAEKRMEAEEA
jgi:hypothetical protein